MKPSGKQKKHGILNQKKHANRSLEGVGELQSSHVTQLVSREKFARVLTNYT